MTFKRCTWGVHRFYYLFAFNSALSNIINRNKNNTNDIAASNLLLIESFVTKRMISNAKKAMMII